MRGLSMILYNTNFPFYPLTLTENIHRTSILFVAIADNSLYGSKLSIFILCQKQLGY